MSKAAQSSPDTNDQETSTESFPRRFGKYTLLRMLARGGMAELFLALHRSIAGFERLIVIKRILPDLARDEGFITMLLQEARIAATFAHPNIVTVFDLGNADGEYFIAMEHIHGEDLRSIVRAMKAKNVREFPLEHAIALGLGAAAGLAYAHEKTDLQGRPLGVVHRDISPQNIIVTFTGDVKVVDFGIAKAALSAEPRSTEIPSKQVNSEGTDTGADPSHKAPPFAHGRSTRAGQLKGKVPYMSPEQARGEPLDARSDIFSLGIILFELCTGRRLFRSANDLQTIELITAGDYPSPSAINPRISPRLESVLNRALAPQRKDRYPNARELLADLEAIVHEEHIPVSSVALGRWMESLFSERLAAQRTALAEGHQLADVIASEPREDFLGDSLPPASNRSSSVSLPPTVPATRKHRALVAAVVTLSVIAVCAVAFALSRQKTTTAARTQTALQGTGKITLRSNPEGAHVWLNGSPTSFRTPCVIERLPTAPNGTFQLRLTANGYTPWAQDVSLSSAHAHVTVSATLSLARADSLGVLELSTVPPGARVIVDGREVPGVSPVTVASLAVDVEHTVLVRLDGYTPERFSFVSRSNATEHRAITLTESALTPGEARVIVETLPLDARVRVGDLDIDTGSPFRLRVPSGRVSTLIFSAPGFVSERRSVQPASGQTVTLSPVHLSHDRRARNR